MMAALILAFLGFGYWALAVGLVLSKMLACTTMLIIRPHRLRIPRSFRSIKNPLTYGAHLVGANMVGAVYQSADSTIIGRRLGTISLGEYATAWNVASIPAEKIGS